MLLKHLLIRGFAFVIAGSFSAGCSNNFVTAVAPNTYSANQNPEYFPLAEGFRTSYEMTSITSSPAMVTYTVGEAVPFQSTTATEWIKYMNGQKDTGYFVLNGSALVLYESKKAAPEIILDFPLSVGKSWSRFDNPSSEISDTIDFDDGILVKDSGQGEPSLSSSFPTEGMDIMTVDKFESIELENGRYFSGVYRVSNDAGNGTRNYYWYAPGVGLIKFIYGASDPQKPGGGLQGELISYGFTF
jgi:hypothetical protein